ncbi:hypothetical protein BST61_g3954 [Cercospora zeina]
MDHFASQSSSPGELDDDPDIQYVYAMGDDGERRVRVRFNSSAAAQSPPVAHEPTFPSAAITQDQIKDTKRPHPILRGPSKDNVPTLGNNAEGDNHAQNRAAAEAQSRGNAMAERVKRDTPPFARNSIDSQPNTEDGESDFELLGKSRDIAMKSFPVDGRKHAREYSHDTLVQYPPSDGHATDLEKGPDDEDPAEDQSESPQKQYEEIFDGYVDGSS